MLDTCAYNALTEDPDVLKLVKGAVQKGYEFYITHVQVDEIVEISDKNKEKRKKAVLFLAYGRPHILLTETGVWGHSRWDFFKFGDEDSVYHKLLNGNKSNIKDALIGETAIKNECTLITDDLDLIGRMVAIGGRVKRYADFKHDVLG
jgi:rRNA-processing protein FCF1